MTTARLALATAFLTGMLFGLGFLGGAMYGWWYGSRDKVCAQIPQHGTSIVVCDYGYEPPEGSFVQ